MPKLLIIGFVWPEPKSSAAGSRMMQLIKSFQEDNYEITFASSCTKTDNAFNLEDINITQVFIKLNDSSFDEFVKELSPEVVLFDRFMIEEQFGWRIAEHCPKALRLLDTEDLHCLRKGRHHALKNKKEFDDFYLFNDIAKREIASIYRCDLSLMISEVEIDILTQKFKVDKALLMYVPFLLDEKNLKTKNSLPKYNSRSHFVTIGNFLHEPNYDAVLYLKQSIWPLIRKKLPDTELHIYGAYESQKVSQLNNKKEGFVIKGFAEDVNQTMEKYRVCLATLRFGAGLKGKLIDAMQNGTPCIMTSIAAEGMFGRSEENGFVEDIEQEIASKAIELYNNEAIWSEKREYGFDILNTRFNKNHFLKNIFKQIEAMHEDLDNHRLQNFTGTMLHHHSMQSTKYMAKWIEEKNK